MVLVLSKTQIDLVCDLTHILNWIDWLLRKLTDHYSLCSNINGFQIHKFMQHHIHICLLVSKYKYIWNGRLLGSKHVKRLTLEYNNKLKYQQIAYVDPDDSEITRRLPREILLRIFSYLDVISLCRCAQVKLNTQNEIKD